MKLLFFDQKDFSEAENRNDAIFMSSFMYFCVYASLTLEMY